MDTYHKWIAFYTMMRKDVVRIFRIWVQTFLPSVISSGLYVVIFGTLLGSRIGTMEGVPFMQFVVPGLAHDGDRHQLVRKHIVHFFPIEILRALDR